MEFKASKTKGYKAMMAVVLAVVLLTFCVLTGTMIAWLTDRDEDDDGGNIHIGSVDFDIYSNGNLITSAKDNANGVSPDSLTSVVSNVVEVTGSTAIRNIDLKIRNTGTVSAIMRVTITIGLSDGNGGIIPCLISETLTIDNQITLNNSGWVNDFAGNNQVASGYSYYNSQIKPYTISSLTPLGQVVSQDVVANEVAVLTQILVPESMKNETYLIKLKVEGVAYSGNIYQEEYDRELGNSYQIPTEAENSYPFGLREDLPSTWNAWKSTAQIERE
jgi:hypothetical protein